MDSNGLVSLRASEGKAKGDSIFLIGNHKGVPCICSLLGEIEPRFQMGPRTGTNIQESLRFCEDVYADE